MQNFRLPVALLFVATAGCFSGNAPGYGIAGNGSGGQGNGGVGAGGGGLTGVPCDVSSMLQNRCVACHNGRALSASSLPLTSYDALVAPSPRNGSQTVAELALSRIRSQSQPMPPAGSAPLSAAEVQAFADWVAADLPPGDCGSGTVGDGGTGSVQYDTPTVCTSNQYVRGGGEDGGWSMTPGHACISCHSRGEGPRFDVAGTVYPTAHEPNDCAGTGSGITVVITDARGQRFRVTPNSVGNFGASHTGLATPYTAVVERNGAELAMVTPQTNGDCNSCHTENGDSSAPGRIMAP